MTAMTILIEDGHEEDLKKMLHDVSFVLEIKDDLSALKNRVSEPMSPYERLVQIQEEIGDKKLFEEIKDPSEWQREIRKEWDRDF